MFILDQVKIYCIVDGCCVGNSGYEVVVGIGQVWFFYVFRWMCVKIDYFVFGLKENICVCRNKIGNEVGQFDFQIDKYFGCDFVGDMLGDVFFGLYLC